MQIGKKYTSVKRRVVRTLLKFSECGKYGYFKCESESRIYNRWIFLNAWGRVTRMIEIEVEEECDNEVCNGCEYCDYGFSLSQDEY